jgi:hypothetical protein
MANAISKNSVFTIYCQIEWELAQYCKEELFGDNGLNHVLTITALKSVFKGLPASIMCAKLGAVRESCFWTQ